MKREGHEDDHVDDKGRTWPNPDPNGRIRQRLFVAYLRGFRAAVSGATSAQGVWSAGPHAYTLGFENGKIAIDDAKELATTYAHATVDA